MRIILGCIFLSLVGLNNIVFAASDLPTLFLFMDRGAKLSKESSVHTLKNRCVSGVQVIYTWKELEPEKNKYDFSRIEKDIKLLESLHKKLFIQLQDRSFQPNLFYVPDYIRKDPAYHGGVAMQYDFPGEGIPITTGWVARVWDPAVRQRFQLLMQKLAERFDGKLYGINLPETAVDFDIKHLPEGFTQDKYFAAELDNLSALKKAFHKSVVVQYVNFFPGEWNNDHGYMGKLFSYAMKHGIGLGGPDVVPYRKSQMKNSYPFFHQFKGKLLTAIAIQQPDYTYKNQLTGKPYTFSEFYHFTRDYLGADILFWNVQEPFLSAQLVPRLNSQYFACDKE